MDSTICHFEIPADDPAAARTFYSTLFSWRIEPIPRADGEYLLLRTSSEPGSVAGGISKRTDDRQTMTLYFAVESLEESLKKAGELGGTVILPRTALPQVGWIATVRDPQGNVIGLFQGDPAAEKK